MANVNFTPHYESKIPRAAGYPDFGKSGMFSEVFCSLLDKNIYQRTCLPRITSSNYLGKIKNKGDKITIVREPKITIQPYVKGGEYKLESSVGEAFSMTLDKALRWAKYYEDLDLKRTQVTGLEAATINAAANTIAETMETEFMVDYCDPNGLGSSIPEANRGNTAGLRWGKYKLGVSNDPYQLTSASILQYLMQFAPVFNEQGVNNESGQRSIILPEAAAYLLRMNEHLLDASKWGQGQTSLKTQQLASLPGIGTIYTSNLLPTFGDNGDIFPVICFTKESVNFVVATQDTKVVEPPLMDGKVLRGRAVYDWAVARPEGMALGFIQPQAIN